MYIRFFLLSLFVLLVACQRNTPTDDKSATTKATQSQNIPAIEGAPTQALSAILQDRTGLLWLGTSAGGGLFTFDGYHSRAYKPDPLNPSSFQGRYIEHLFEDSKGNIWIGTAESGLHLYQPQTGKFSQYLH